MAAVSCWGWGAAAAAPPPGACRAGGLFELLHAPAAVGQPVAWLHRNLSSPEAFEADADLEAFHDAVVAAPKVFEWHDLSSMFDDELAVVPMRVDEIMDDTIFLDDVHMRGRGNAMVAARIVPWLTAPAAEVTPPK